MVLFYGTWRRGIRVCMDVSEERISMYLGCSLFGSGTGTGLPFALNGQGPLLLISIRSLHIQGRQSAEQRYVR
jgi:hypothetical protein